MTRRVFVDLPGYSPNSNGIRCLYELADMLSQKGMHVIGIPRNLDRYLSARSRLPNQYQDIPITCKPFGSRSDILIASETAPKRTIHSARQAGILIIWWQLAPYRLLDGNMFPLAGDLSLPFSSYVEPDQKDYFFYQPRIDKDWESALNQALLSDSPKKTLLFYCGKGRLTRLPVQILELCKRSEIKVITREYPTSRSELFKLLRASKGLISFDELTNLNLEAASVGVPVFLAEPLFPASSRELFSIEKFRLCVTSEPNEFIDLIKQHEASGLQPFRRQTLLEHNERTLEGICRIISRPDEATRYVVTEEKRSKWRDYTRSLKSHRSIYAHLNGQAGGTLLLGWYMKNVSLGSNRLLTQVAIRILDTLYRYLRCIVVPMTNLGRRLPLRLKRRKGALEKLGGAFISGNLIYTPSQLPVLHKSSKKSLL